MSIKKHIFIITVFVSLSAGLACGELSENEMHVLTGQAGKLFNKANGLVQSDPDQAKQLYRQVVLRYQKIIEEGGVANEHLYYNIANAYLLMGDVGRAILNYRRAERFGSDNPELMGNLGFARSKRIDQVPVKTQKRVLQTLFFWHYDFAARTRFILAGVFWAVMCVAGSCRLWLRVARRFLSWLIIVGLVGTACLSVSVWLDVQHSRNNTEGVIVAKKVVARQGDGLNYPGSFREPLHSGTEFGLSEKRGDWLKIELSNGDQAWIPANSAEII